MKIKNYKYYKILNIEKLGKTGDYKKFLWKIQNTKTDAQFSYITTTSGTRVATERIRTNDDITEDAWPFVKFNLDKGIEKDEHKIELYSDSELGKYFTPPAVVDFIFDILNVLKNKEDKETHRWQSHKPRPHHPSVIDPACGEGIFLKRAVESSFTGEDTRFKAPYVWGIDIDESVVTQWENISILKMFHGGEEKMKNHFYHQNGLMPLKHKTLMYKKGVDDLQHFDTVVGNPPYGGIGVKISDKEHLPLFEALRQFEIFRYRKQKSSKGSPQLSLVGDAVVGEAIVAPSLKVTTKEAQSIPIEILFIERFLQLCKPGGWVAIIIPDGILANSTYDYVRRFIAERAKVLGIVSLPRGTFKEAGTSAKTSIMFLQKVKDKLLTGPNDLDYPVFLVSTNTIEKEYFDIIVKEFKSFVETRKLIMDKNNKNPKVRRYTDGKEAYMVRGDKLIKEIMEEKPSGRWDVYHWHPNFDLPSDLKYEIKYLGNFITEIRQGDTARKHLGEKYLSAGIPFLSAASIEFTGIDLSQVKHISEKQNQRLRRTQIKTGDIIFGMIGVAGVGRVGYLHQKVDEANINCTVDLIRVKNISPIYVVIYLKCKFGKGQVERIKSGVGPPAMNNDEIKSIKIPVVPIKTQHQIETEYLKMSKFHDKAMEAKKRGDEKEYKGNLETAEKMLKDLIARTEAVIRGERKDVI